jgi:hypothetical protein
MSNYQRNEINEQNENIYDNSFRYSPIRNEIIEINDDTDVNNNNELNNRNDFTPDYISISIGVVFTSALVGGTIGFIGGYGIGLFSGLKSAEYLKQGVSHIVKFVSKK